MSAEHFRLFLEQAGLPQAEAERIIGAVANAELSDADLERITAGKGPAQAGARGVARGTAAVGRGAVWAGRTAVGGAANVTRAAIGAPFGGGYGWY